MSELLGHMSLKVNDPEMSITPTCDVGMEMNLTALRALARAVSAERKRIGFPKAHSLEHDELEALIDIEEHLLHGVRMTENLHP